MVFLNFLVKLWRQFNAVIDEMQKEQEEDVQWIHEPPVAPLSEVVMPPKKNMLTVLATAFRDFEGQPGDLNYRNNNPGNYRCSPVGYLPKYGNVKCVNKFAVFPTYELGWEYHCNSLMHWAHLHPTWTITQLVYHYAPPSDSNPTDSYVAHIAKACGVPASTTLQELLS